MSVGTPRRLGRPGVLGGELLPLFPTEGCSRPAPTQGVAVPPRDALTLQWADG